jgi:hypothetical protein
LRQALYTRHLELIFNALIARDEVIAASHVMMFLLKYSVLSEIGRKRLPSTSSKHRKEVEQEFLRLHHEWQLKLEVKFQAMSTEELERVLEECRSRDDADPPRPRSILDMQGQELDDALRKTSVDEMQGAIEALKEMLKTEG